MDVSIRDKQCDATSRLPARIKCNLEQEKKKKNSVFVKATVFCFETTQRNPSQRRKDCICFTHQAEENIMSSETNDKHVYIMFDKPSLLM